MYLTILTPAYNRAHTLSRLYNSLEQQTCKEFNWVIVDDGSTDNTKELIDEIRYNASIKISYIYKKNGGKHTAINKGIDNITTSHTFVVDSDDCLVNNAVEIIYSKWRKYKERKDISSIWFLQMDFSGDLIGDPFRENEFVSTYTKEIINSKIKGDKRSVYLTDLRKKFPFPIFKGENFIGESTVHMEINRDYNSVFVNEKIYVGEYLQDGLTTSGMVMRMRNPLGGMENSIKFTTKDVILSTRYKKMTLFIIYGLLAKNNIFKILSNSGNIYLALSCLPLVLSTLIFWKLKRSI